MKNSFHSLEDEDLKFIFVPHLPFWSLGCCSALEIIRTSEFHYLDGEEEEGGPSKIILKEIRYYLIKEKHH
jgi:hypothetical protein